MPECDSCDMTDTIEQAILLWNPNKIYTKLDREINM